MWKHRLKRWTTPRWSRASKPDRDALTKRREQLRRDLNWLDRLLAWLKGQRTLL